jgi:hypothetical protein
MPAFSPLQPFARLWDLSQDDGHGDATMVASTSNVLAWSISWFLDKPGRLTITVGVGDAGDSAGGDDSFATALLKGAGGADSSALPVPTLLEFSLDGGTAVDSRKIVEKPMRDEGSLTCTEEGDDLLVVYALVVAGGGHATPQGCHLADVLGASQGTIIPINGGADVVAANGKIPFLTGLLNPVASVVQQTPGLASWPAGARTRLTFTAVLDPLVAFGTPTNLDTYADTVLRALNVLATRLGGAVIAGDTLPQGVRGHLVGDSSDSSLNLAARFAGVVCDGTPTPGSPAGTNGYSNAAGRGGGVARTVVMGTAGASVHPSGGFLFDGSDVMPIADEAESCRLDRERVTITPDLSALYRACQFRGGASNAGLPAGARITAITTLNNTPSGSKDAYTDCMPIVGISVNDATGGLYYWIGDGLFRPWPYSPPIAVLDIAVDTYNDQINIATAHGVYHTSSSFAAPGAWTQVGGLTGRVTRLSGVPVGGPPLTDYKLYAMVEGDTPERNGIYRYDGGTLPGEGAGYNGWRRYASTDAPVSFCSTDNHSFFHIDKSDQNKVWLFDTTSHAATRFSLPANVQATRLDRVTAETDTVYISTVGDGQSGYYLSYDTGTNSWVTNGVRPVYLLVNGAPLKVNKFMGPLVAINPASSVTVRVFACTDGGLYYSATNTPTHSDGSDWLSANGQSGLAGVAVQDVAVGQAVRLLGLDTSRVFACNDSQFFESNNAMAAWQDVSARPVDKGPAFSGIVLRKTGDLPTNSIRTVGTMASSPLGLAGGTHVQIIAADDALPTAWYIERRLNQRMEWEYWTTNGTCPTFTMIEHEIAEIEASESSTLDVASGLLLALELYWLGENSQTQTVLDVPSSFTQTTAGLRRLRPTQEILLTLQGTVAQKSSTGAVLPTTYVDYSAASFYVLEHTISGRGGEPAASMTRVGTQLGKNEPDDLVASLRARVKALSSFGVRRRRT